MSNPLFLTTFQVDRLKSDLECNPSDLNALISLSQHFSNQNEHTQACSYYEKIVEIQPDNGKAWTLLGHCYLLKPDYQKSLASYQQALNTLKNTNDAQLWYGIGLNHDKFENYDLASTAFQTVLKLSPDFAQKSEVLFNLGLVHKKSKSFQFAKLCLKDSIGFENIPISRKIEVLCHIGNCCEKENKLDDAFVAYEEALCLDEANFKTLEHLGWVLVGKGRFEEALEKFEKAIELAKENCVEVGDLWYLIGRTQLEMKRYAEGQAAFQKAIYKNPSVGIYWNSIGVLYAKAMQPQDAFECFVKAERISQDGRVWFNMGVLYEHCSQRSEAVLAYQKAVSLDGSMEVAKERKHQLQSEEDLQSIPDFAHLIFEITEFPFSAEKNEEKMIKNSVDTHEIQMLTPIIAKKERPGSESSDECSLEIAPADDLEKKNTEFLPKNVLEMIKVEVVIPNCVKSEIIKTENTIVDKGKLSKSSGRFVKIRPDSSSNRNLHLEPAVITQTKVISGITPSSSLNTSQISHISASSQIASSTNNEQATNQRFCDKKEKPNCIEVAEFAQNNLSDSINSKPQISSAYIPDIQLNMYGIPQNTYGMPQNSYEVPQNMCRVPQNMYGAPQNISGMPQNIYGTPQNNYFMHPNMFGTAQNIHGIVRPPQNLAKVPPNMPNMSLIPQRTPQIQDFFIPNLFQSLNGSQMTPMMMGMFPAIPQSMPIPAPQMNPFQLAQLQTMMMAQMMNPMAEYMQRMRAMQSHSQNAKKEKEDDAAKTLTKLNRDERGEDFRRKRKGDKSKDLVIKKRKS